MTFDSFRTTHLLARPATPADEGSVLAVYAGNEPLLRLLDRESEAREMTSKFLHGENLPPSGRPELLHNLALCIPSTPGVAGLLSLYIGYPQVRTLYIGELFLHPSVQGRGLGREVCLRLEELCRKASLRRIRVGVALRNWNALRFWIKLGFLDVTGMSGDRVFAPDAYAFLELQRKL